MNATPNKLRIYQVDAFTDRPFGGNPAALCPLDEWIETDRMQAIAAENNLSETAFFVGSDGHYDLRWFTPTVEVDLCGHATLATAWLLFETLEDNSGTIHFETRSGRLSVQRDDGLISMDLPAIPAQPCEAPAALLDGLGERPAHILAATNYLTVYDDAEIVAALTPDFAKLAGLTTHGVIATARGKDCDFVSRFFAPAFGIDEDPVTGSAHCTLTPYWSEVLNENVLDARQISSRGGRLRCTNSGNGRVAVAGRCALYLEGEIRI
jgi:PhzF family phenazine biosynthesis protein